MSYDFQTVNYYRSDNSVKISHSGSNFYTTPEELNDEDPDSCADALWVSGIECVILHIRDSVTEPWNQSTWAFFRDYKRPRSAERFLTLQQAVNSDYHVERVLENGNPEESIIDELETGFMPDKILRFLIEINIANATDRDLGPEDIAAILKQ